jgi:hypothetical protein
VNAAPFLLKDSLRPIGGDIGLRVRQPGPAKLRIETDSEPSRNQAFEYPQDARAIDLALKQWALPMSIVRTTEAMAKASRARHRRWSVRSLTLEGEESGVAPDMGTPSSHPRLALGLFFACGPRARWQEIGRSAE